MSKQYELGHYMAPAVLEHLGKLCTLPKEGILAGQSVCSALLDLFGPGGGVYNDVDVFLRATAAQAAELSANREEEALSLGLTVASFDEYDGAGIESYNNYTIVATVRDGNLNYVWCTTPQELGNWSATRLLMSFDINCVEVAIDLERGRLYWTPAFEFFWRTRQLQLTSMHTPARTMLRYAKKRKELAAAYGDDEFTMQMLAAMAHDSVGSLEHCFGGSGLAPKHAELFHELPVLHEWFSLGPQQEDLRYPVLLERQAKSAFVERFSVVADSVPETLIPRLMYAEQLQKPANYEALNAHFKKMLSECSLTSEAFQTFGLEYLRGNHSPRHVTTIADAVEDHNRLDGALFGLTLDQQYQAVRELNRRAKHEGSWVYGVVETQAVPLDMMSLDNIADFFERESNFAAGALSEKLFEDITYKDWHIKQLVTRKDLGVEGEVMGHCVGGYSTNVQNKLSVILSIRKGNDKTRWTTVELNGGKLEDEQALVISQHRSRRNENAHRDNRRVLHLLLTWLAKTKGLTYKKSSRKKNDVFDDLFDF